MVRVIVITADRRNSRSSNEDAVPGILQQLADVTPVSRPFTRTIGDEVQGTLPLTEEAIVQALPLALDVLGTADDWWIGIGVGSARLGSTTVDSTGPAFYAAREAIDLAKRGDLTGSIALRVGFERGDRAVTDAFEAAIRLELPEALGAVAGLETGARELWRAWEVARIALAHHLALLRGRSPQGREAVARARLGGTREQMGDDLGISRQAVDKRLASAGWPRAEHESQHLLGLAMLALTAAMESA